MKLNLVIGEAALELVPEETWRHPAVAADSKRRQVPPASILLDRSLHHAAMNRLKDGLKRGRPDLVHLTLLTITSTPLYQDGLVKVFIHTQGDFVLDLKERTRPPKSYFRFRSLIEKLFTEKPRSGLITVERSPLPELLRQLNSDLKAGLSVQGEPKEFDELASELVARRNPVAVVGGFPHGHFSPSTLKTLDELVRVHPRPLDAHVVAGRLIQSIETKLDNVNQR